MSPGVSAADVAVVGAGVIGAACARAAARAGLRVAVVDQGPQPGAASPASAGMLAAQTGAADPAALAVRARDRYASLAPALKDSTGIDVGLWTPGIASLALDDDEATTLQDVVARHRRAGLRTEWLEPDDVRRRWPGLAPELRGALFAPEDGALDPPALVRALLADALLHGATVLADRAESVTAMHGRVSGLATARGACRAPTVVIAAGAWSPRVGGLPAPLPVEPVRGQLAVTTWPRDVPPGIFLHHHAYVLTRAGGAILGSTMERAGFDARPTDDGIAHILAHTRRLLPSLGALAVQRAWAGLRPVTPDNQPIVGADESLPGLWYATGHGRNGVLLAALTGEIVADLLTTGATSVDISMWRPGRWAAAGNSEPADEGC